MSDDFRVEVVAIEEVRPHPNADKLDVAKVYGWEFVVGKGQFKAGDVGIYFPVDSVLSHEVESVLFANSKIQLHHSRVRAIKIRGFCSMGLLATLNHFPKVSTKVGTDVAEALGIHKYEPPAPTYQQNTGNNIKSKKKVNHNFKEYTKIHNAKWYPELFAVGEEVVMTEKIHGTNFRCGYAPTEVNSLWKKIKRFFGVLESHEWVYGSHRVQLQFKANKNGGFYGEDVYGQAAEKFKLHDILKPGEILYGEIYGMGIQKGYDYGLKDSRSLVAFDIEVNGVFLSHDEIVTFCTERGIPMVPVIYRGPYKPEILVSVTSGKSVMCPDQKIREGTVVRPVVEQLNHVGRKILKSINPDYLAEPDNTDFH